jgi:DNA invertase Pin-like site-specific DNA recombinase
VLYLRVSTDRQVRKDYDPEGYSIPSQRDAGERRAEALDAVVIRCYTKYGETGRNTRRPALQLMLAEFPPTYVIVYDLSRLARNRLDDATLLMQIESLGAKLVSVAESIDATPAGRLMHGVLAPVNEFRSLADGEKVKLGLARKHAGGGSMGPAKLGYLKVIEMVEGREVRTIVVDPDRSGFIKEAFALCGSGDYSLLEICEVLQERGLRSRPTATRPQSRSGGRCSTGCCATTTTSAWSRSRASSGPGATPA